MRYSCASFYLGKDLSAVIRANSGRFALSCAVALVGAGLGIYFATLVAPSEAPFGVFASLFAGEYTPFIWIKAFFLRFLLCILLASIGFFLSFPYIPLLAGLLIFAKYVSEVAAICFLTDGLLLAILSAAIVYLPILLLGTFLLFFLLLELENLRICRGNPPSRRFFGELTPFLLKLLLTMFLWCILLFVGVCGAIYIVIIAV